MYKNIKPLIIVVYILITACLCSNIYGEQTMKSMYSLNKALMPTIEPKVYSSNKIELQGLLDFPMDNTIATNMLPGTNAITRIDFNDKKLKYKTVAKNFKSYVGGGDTVYAPIFSDDWIGYSQNRGFTLLNIQTKECRYYSIAGDNNMIIRGINVIDATKFIFMFNIQIIPVGGYDFFSDETDQVTYRLLRILDLSGNVGKIINEKKIDSGIGVINQKETIFFIEGNIINAYNLKFEIISHPLVEVFKQQYKSENKIDELIIHPYLPFAVFGSQNKTTYVNQLCVINWGIKDNKDNIMFFLIFDNGSFYHFSYDGEWLIVESSVLGKRSYIIFPIDKELPQYLGKPIYLGEVPIYPSGSGSSAMTRNPSGLVVSDCTNSDEYFLKKWDFTEAEKLIEKKHK